MPRNEDNATAVVGAYSRESGRASVSATVERLLKEREQLLQEKRTIEVQLSDIESWRRQETAAILRKRLDKSRSIEATTTLEGEARAKKATLIRDKETIEQRLFDIKTRLRETPRIVSNEPRHDVEVLLRIEQLLITIIETINRTTPS